MTYQVAAGVGLSEETLIWKLEEASSDLHGLFYRFTDLFQLLDNLS